MIIADVPQNSLYGPISIMIYRISTAIPQNDSIRGLIFYQNYRVIADLPRVSLLGNILFLICSFTSDVSLPGFFLFQNYRMIEDVPQNSLHSPILFLVYSVIAGDPQASLFSRTLFLICRTIARVQQVSIYYIFLLFPYLVLPSFWFIEPLYCMRPAGLTIRSFTLFDINDHCMRSTSFTILSDALLD